MSIHCMRLQKQQQFHFLNIFASYSLTIFSRKEKRQGKNVNIFDRAAVKKCIRKIAGNMTTKVVKAQKKKKKKG